MRVSLSCVLVTSVFWTLVLHHPVSCLPLWSSANAAGSQDDLGNDTEPEAGPSLRRERERERVKDRDRERPRRKDTHDHGEFTIRQSRLMLRKHTGWFDESCVLQEAGWTVTRGRRSPALRVRPRWWAVSWTPPASSTRKEDSASRWVFKAFLLLFETDVWWTISNQDHKTNSNSDYDDILLTRLLDLD